MMRFSLIHISDFHFRNDQENLLRTEALVRDILAQEFNYPAHLIISGDLVDNGGHDLYDDFFETLLSPIMDKFISIHCTPGNHDIQRDATTKEKCEQLIKQSDDAYLWASKGKLTKCSPFESSDPLKNYFTFQEACCSNEVQSYFGTFSKTNSFDLVTLNSAWLSCDRGDAGDKGYLRIEPIVIDNLVENFSDEALKIVVTHHPIDWLDENIKQQVESRIGKHFDVHLCGHSHYNKTSTQIFENDNCICIQASASKSDYSVGNNGYSIIDVDELTKAVRVRYRVYASPRNMYVDGVEIAPNGITYPLKEHETIWRDIEQTDTNSILAKCISDLSQEVIDNWYDRCFIVKNKIYAKFVEPEFMSQQTVSSLHSKIKLGALIERRLKRVLIKGPGDSGLSTSAFLAGKHYLLNLHKFKMIPAYINLGDKSIDRANLLRLARNGVPFELSKKEMESLCEKGEVVFLFDGASIRDADRFNKLISTLDQYFDPVSTIIFSTSNGRTTSLDAHLDLSPNKDEIYELCQMSAELIDDLIEGWDSPNDFDRSVMVGKVISSFKQMDEPVFPPTVLLLLETLKQLPDYQPINRVQLLDRYVECLLGRLQTSDVMQGRFNSNNKIRLLSKLSVHFLEQKFLEISRYEWVEFCNNYSKNLMIELPDSLLDEFLTKGILFEAGGKITFRADYLFTYFVAKEMSSDKILFKKIMSDDYFFGCLREMAFFCELEETNNSKVLDRVCGVLKEIEQEVFDLYKSEEMDFENEWQKMLSEDCQGDTKVEEDIADLSEQQPTKESLSNAQQQDLSSIQRKRGITSRDEIEHIESKWLAVLSTYLQLVKHSINLDAETKIEHFSAALKSAEFFMKGLAVKRHLFVKYPYVLVSGILYINGRVLSDPEKAKSHIKYDIPSFSANFVFDNLFNSQLFPVFKNFDCKNNKETAFYIARLLLGVNNANSRNIWLSIFDKVLDPVLKKSALNSLKRQYLGYAITQEQRKFFEGILQSLSRGKSELTQHQLNQLKRQSQFTRIIDKKTQ